MALKQIPSWPKYFAGDDGVIYRDDKPLVSRDNGRGYRSIKLSDGPRRQDLYVHRLVCEAFHGACPEGMECRHLDGDRSNNAPANLQWSDKVTNERDKINHGTVNAGERNGGKKITEAIVVRARNLAAAGWPIQDIAMQLNAPRGAVRDAIRGRKWKHLPGAIPAPKIRNRDESGRWL